MGSFFCLPVLAPAQTSAKPPASATPAAKPPAPVDSGITATPTTDPNKVVLSVDGETMTAAQFEKFTSAFPPQLQAALRGPQRRTFVDQYVQLLLASKEAEKMGLDKTPEVHQQLELQKDQVLASALYQHFSTDAKVTDAEVQQYYTDHKTDFETAKAHHILIRVKGSPVPLGKDKKDLTDEEALAKAKEVQKRVMAGEYFEKVAKETSDDTSGKGGDLGTVKHGAMVKEFDEAVFTLPVGKVSDPVKTQFGYHIIRVDSREEKPLAEVKAEIETKLRPEMAKKQMDALKAKANVTIDEQFFTPPSPTAKK